jgi:hypothetical protein
MPRRPGRQSDLYRSPAVPGRRSGSARSARALVVLPTSWRGAGRRFFAAWPNRSSLKDGAPGARTAKIASILAGAASLVGFAVAMPTVAGSQPASTGRSAVTKSASPAAAHTPGTQTSPASAADADPDAMLLAAASPVSYIPQPSGFKAPTTATAVLDELLKLLPLGKTSNYDLYTGSDSGAQVYLTDASGTGMIRIHVISGSLNREECAGIASDITVTCSTLPQRRASERRQDLRQLHTVSVDRRRSWTRHRRPDRPGHVPGLERQDQPARANGDQRRCLGSGEDGCRCCP